MNFKKILLISVAHIALLNALDMPPMPPMIGEKKATKKSVHSDLPKSCELLPPMIFRLPPPMAKELTKCNNELNIPKATLVQKQLSIFLHRKVKITKIEILKSFNQLYKVTYDGGVILTNSSADAFIKQ